MPLAQLILNNAKNDLSAGHVLTCSKAFNAAKLLEAPGRSIPPGSELPNT